jgi:hypothetical protein
MSTVGKVLIRITVIRYRDDGREFALEQLECPILDDPAENSHSNPYECFVNREFASFLFSNSPI